MKKRTVCFTGHRKIPSEQYEDIAERLKKEIIKSIEEGYCFFCAGGALGFDTLAAQTVLQLKNQYPQICLYLILPYHKQTRGWKEEDVREYERIKSLADKVFTVSDEYYRGCMQKRNRDLVDNSSLCICFKTEDTGGTAYTIQYASKKGLKIINIGEHSIRN